MKKTLPLPLCALGFALGGYLLRRWELATGFEPSGLAVPGHPSNLWMVALALAAALTTLVLAKVTAGSFGGYLEGFQWTSPLRWPVYALAGGLLALGGCLGLYDRLRGLDFGLSRTVLALSLLPAGVCLLLTARANGRRDPQKGRELACLLVPGYAAAVWLVRVYQGHTANPEPLEYAFLLLGVIAAALALLFQAGFSFEKPRPVWTLWSSAMGVVLLTVDMADRRGRMELCLEAGLALYLLAQTTLLCYHSGHSAQLEEPERMCPASQEEPDEPVCQMEEASQEAQSSQENHEGK